MSHIILIDHTNKILEAIECDSVSFRCFGKKEMIVSIVGGNHADERVRCGGVCDISAYDSTEYKGFRFGKIMRISKDELFEQQKLF